MPFDFDSLPELRGKMLKNASLAPYTWFRVGGPADALYLPADDADLASFFEGSTRSCASDRFGRRLKHDRSRWRH